MCLHNRFFKVLNQFFCRVKAKVSWLNCNSLSIKYPYKKVSSAVLKGAQYLCLPTQNIPVRKKQETAGMERTLTYSKVNIPV